MTEQYPILSENSSFQEKIENISNFSKFKDFYELFESSKELQEKITELLEYIDVDDTNYDQYLKENSDFWNDRTQNGNHFCDLITEWADSQVDLYNDDIWKNAPKFRAFEETYFFEFGSETAAQDVKEGGITRLLQQIQYTAYYQFACKVLALLAEDAA